MKVEILGIKIDDVTFNQAVLEVVNFLKDGKKHYIVTPNPEIVVLAQKDKNLRKILNSADLAIPDGTGLVWASKVLGLRFSFEEKIKNLNLTPSTFYLKQRVTGVDLIEKICQTAAKKGFKVGLLGGRNNLAEKCAQVLRGRYPKLRLVVFNENSLIEESVDILFVAFGAPKQEKWIAKNLPQIPVKVAIGVGGAFEMITGFQKRAPKFLQNLGVEWFWRLVNQPWRIKRQIKLLVFIYLVIREKLKT